VGAVFGGQKRGDQNGTAAGRGPARGKGVTSRVRIFQEGGNVRKILANGLKGSSKKLFSHDDQDVGKILWRGSLRAKEQGVSTRQPSWGFLLGSGE